MVATAVVVGFSGCGKNEEVTTVEEATTVEESDATVEQTVEKEESIVTPPFLSDREKYDSIISKLTTDQYYAFAGIGEDYDALLVADGVFDNGDGNMAAIDAKVYGIGEDGVIYEAGSVWSDGTAYPLAVYENSIMFGGNHHMTMACVKDASVIIEKEADEVFDEQCNVTDTYNEGNIDDIKTVEDDSILSEMFKTYESAVVINFFQGEAEVVYDPELGDYPSNNFEVRVGKTSFESYDEIIGLLEGDEAYAFVNMKGYDEKVLLVGDHTFQNTNGDMVVTECTPYTYKSTGLYTADSMLFSGEEREPLKIDSDGIVYSKTQTSIEKNCYGDNGTPNKGIMVLAYVYVDALSADGTPKTIGGFVRTNNSVIEDDSVFLEGNEIDIYTKLFEEYEKAVPIPFTGIK